MKRFHARYNPASKRWIACTAGDAVAHRCITVDFAPPAKPGTFVNPRQVLADRWRAERIIAAQQERMKQA